MPPGCAGLLGCGLLRGSFVPPAAIRQLRDLCRYRKRLTQAHGAECQRVQKTLEDAGSKQGLGRHRRAGRVGPGDPQGPGRRRARPQDALPAVLPATRRAVRDAALQRQFRFLAGDLFQAQLGRGIYDLAIAGNLCHLFDETANRRLLGRLYDTLRPGGALAVVDVIPDEQEQSRPRWVVLYELGLLLRTAGGRVHPLAAYLGWLHDAGFEPPERHCLVDAAQAVLLIARKLAA